MPIYEVSQLSPLSSPATGDLVGAVDVSDTTTDPAGPNGSNKKITLSSLATALAGMSNSVTFIAPSGDTSGTGDAASINAAVTALAGKSGTILLGAGAWYLVPGHVTVSLTASQSVVIEGRWAVVINAVAGSAGDVIRMYNPTSQAGNYSGNKFSVRSGVRGVTIDGTSATAGSSGLHVGDLMNLQLDVAVQNFSGTGSIGLHLDNTVTWCEQADVRASLINNTLNVVFDVTGTGTQSYGYGYFDFSVQGFPGQDGVCIRAGSQPYSSLLRIRGNFGASTSNTGAVLRLTGVAPSGSVDTGQPSELYATELDIDVECNPNISNGGTVGPYTVYVDTGTGIFGCTGNMNFNNSGGTFTAANAVAAGNLQFQGPVLGDTTIQVMTMLNKVIYESPVGIGNYASAQTVATGGTVTVTSGLSRITSTAAVTGVILPAGALDGQLLTVLNTGANPVTFAVSGTSRVADGTADILAAATMRLYVWSATQSLWYPAGTSASGGGGGSTTVAGDLSGTTAAAVVTGLNGHPLSTGAAWGALAGSHTSHLQNWFISLAQSNAAPTVVAFIGDSFTAGFEAGLDFSQTWPVLVGNRVKARFTSTVATGTGRGMLPPGQSGTISTTSYVTVSGGSLNAIEDFGYNFCTFDISGGVTLTYSLTGTTAIIRYLKLSGGGTFSWKVDGGSATNVSTSNSTTSDTGTVTVTLGAVNTTHTLTIAFVSGGVTCIDAVIEHNGDASAGLQFWNCGQGGTETSDWAGFNYGAFTGMGVALVVLELMGNDWEAGVSVATATANMSTVISKIRTAMGSTIPIVLVPPPAQYDPSASVPWSSYVAAQYAIAAADSNIDICDLTLRMPAGSAGNTPNSIYDASSGELTIAGHQMVANFVSKFLEPA